MRWSAVLLSAVCGCGLAGTFDSGAWPVRVEADTSVDSPATPQPAAAPSLLPCPPGWLDVEAGPGDAQRICEPWTADAGVPTCGVDEARFVDTDACTLVGTPCTADDWASGLPASGVRYVKAGAAAGGTGTRTAPFATVAEAMAGAAPGTVLALSKGTFTEDVRVSPGVVLWGACVGQTLLRGAGGTATVRSGGLGGQLKNLRVTGPTLGVLVNPSGNQLRLDDVVIDGARGVAMLVGNTAAVTGRNVVIRNTEANTAGAGGRGISCEYGGQVTLEHAVFENNRENAVNVINAMGRVSLADAVLRATRPRTDGVMGRGGTASTGATLELTRTLVEQNTEVALLAGSGAALNLTDVLVRDTRNPAGDDGLGIVLEGATGTWRRVAVQRSAALAVQLRSASTLDAQDLVLVDTREDAQGYDGVGLDVIERSTVALERAHFARHATYALAVNDSVATLTDVRLADTRSPTALADLGSALQVSRGASVTVTRLELHRSQGVGLLVDGAGSVVQGRDVTATEGQAFRGAPGGGAALVAQAGATVTLGRVRLAGNQSVGVQVQDPGTQVRLEDLAVLDTDSESGAGTYGRAMHVQAGATVSLTRAALERSRDTGLFVNEATVTATHLLVRDVTKRACTVAETCDDRGGSAVVVVGAGARLTATRFRLETSAQCGLQLAASGDAALARGAVRGHAIGVCLQVPGFDVAKLQDEVIYESNGRNLDAQDVPLPTLTVPTYRPK